MKNILRAAVVIALMTGTVYAGEKRINVQGKLTQADGVTAIAGTHDVTLRLYDSVASTSGIVFAEKHAGVNLGTTGLFNLMLGQGTVLTPPNKALDTVAFNRQYYVGIQIDNDAAEIGSRQALGASSYALGSIGNFNAGNIVASGVTVTGADFSVGGTTVVVKKGLMGVGTASPSAKVHAVSTSEQLRLGYDATRYASFSSMSNGSLRIAPYSGSTIKTVAIGAIPEAYQAPLQVQGIDGTVSYITMRLDGNGSGRGTFIHYTDHLTYNFAAGAVPTSGDFAFISGRYPGQAGNERMRITQGGNIGIGTTSPLSRLHIIPADNNGLSGITVGSGINQSVNTKLSLSTVNSESYLTAQGNGVWGALHFRTTPDGINFQTPLAVCGGNVGVGTVNPQFPLDIRNGVPYNSLSAFAYLTADGNVGYIAGSGGVVPVSLFTAYRILVGGEIDVISDMRLKEDVALLNGGTALSAIKKLQPRHFKWKQSTKKGDAVVAGFYAQDLKEIIPEAVTQLKGQDFDDEYAMNYNMVTTYSIAAIQQLSKENERLQTQLADCLSRLKSVEEAVTKMKSSGQ